MIALKVFLIIVVGIMPLMKLLDWLETKLVYRDNGYGLARRKAVESEVAAGASYLEAQETLLLREMLARIRREASDSVSEDPHMWHQHIQDAKERAMREVGLVSPHLAKRLGDAVSDLSYGHILYPIEAKMVDRLWLGRLEAGPSADQMAAVRLVRR